MPSPTLTTPTNDEIFETWLGFRSRDPFDPLTPVAARPYRSMWTSWCRHLVQQSAPKRPLEFIWIDADAIDLQRFLYAGAIQPARHGKNNPSEISRHRYWRVLSAVYDYAKDRQIIDRVPTAELDESDKPFNERSRGQVFHSNDWQKIVESIPDGFERWDVRNRAMLYLLMDSAITTAEAASLRLGQLITRYQQIQVAVDGKRQAQQRTIELSSITSKHLRDWLDDRAELPEPKNGHKDALFLTQKGNSITTTGIYHLVSATIARALVEHDTLLSHTGAQAIRNTRLIQWLNDGVPMFEVVRRAGFKDVKSFRGIREHIDPSVMPALKPRQGYKTD